MDFPQTLDYLFAKLPMYQLIGKSAFKKDLSKTLALCKVLNQPQDHFKSIHIAGTNGKGSVSHALASVFQTAGFKTGLYTSPHLKDFRERIKINGKMIPEGKVIDFVEKNKLEFEKIQPSFFEWTVALAFDYFATEKVDIAIVETGLGGRLDSTNIIQPELSIITNIGLDHIDMLGDNLASIAKEKAGIIKAATPVVIGNDSGQKIIFDEIAVENNSAIYYAEDFYQDLLPTSDLKGIYQKENIRTVMAGWKVLVKKGWKISKQQVENAIENVVLNTGLQGRWQQLNNLPKVIADVAHNKEGFQYVWQQIAGEKFQKLHLVVGFVKEKDLDDLFIDFPKNAHYYFCQANIPRAMPKEITQEKAAKFGLKGDCFNSVELAYAAALKAADVKDFIYVGGSNFVVAEIL